MIFAPAEVSKTIRIPIIDSEKFNLVTQVVNHSSENLAEEFNIYVDSFAAIFSFSKANRDGISHLTSLMIF